jgi:hypothetical protein
MSVIRSRHESANTLFSVPPMVEHVATSLTVLRQQLERSLEMTDKT